jgi:hypothetical protein
MEPLDFLRVAESLQPSAQEAERRTSIGRSYYAMFNYLRLKVDPIRRVPIEDAHQAMTHYLSLANNKELSSVGQTLSDLRTTRNTADYEMDAVISADDSALALRRAKRAIAKFDSLPEPTVRAALQARPLYQSRRRT